MNKATTKQPYSIFSPVFLLCTMCGLGKIPLFPGTIGSLYAALEFSLYLQNIRTIMPFIIYLILFLPIILYCIYCYCKNTGNLDPKEVIIDEYYGQYIAQLLSYIICYRILVDDSMLYLLIVLSFIFFRIFDISKVSLVGYCDKNIKNAYGVLLDDVVAGFFAAICCSVLVFIVYIIYY